MPTRCLGLAAVLLLAACGGEVSPTAEEKRTAPDLLAVTCDTREPMLDAQLVRARADGLHVVVDNRTSTSVEVRFSADIDSGPWSIVAPPRTSAHVVPAPPGTWDVRCDPVEGPFPREAPTARARVVDPDGFYVSTELACGETDGVTGAMPAGARGERGSPVEAAATFFRRIDGELDYEIERAGYGTDATQTLVRLVRDGEVLGRASLSPDGVGGWLVDSFERCR
ncbi:MAG: hypothetical protein R3C15_09210 [Thermoleophilia bacterium]